MPPTTVSEASRQVPSQLQNSYSFSVTLWLARERAKKKTVKKNKTKKKQKKPEKTVQTKKTQKNKKTVTKTV